MISVRVPSLLPPFGEEQYPWGEFFERASTSTFFHQWNWFHLLEEAYGIRTLPILLEVDGEVIGTSGLSVLGGLLGRRVVSSPFSDYGGPVFDCRPTSDAISSYCKAVDTIARRERSAYALVKSVPETECAEFAANGYTFYANLVTFLINREGTNNNFRQRYEKRTKGVLRLAEGRGLYVRELNPLAEMGLFYRQYLSAMHRLGSPPHSAKFFELISTRLEHRRSWKVIPCFSNNSCVGAVLLLLWKNTAHYYMGAWSEDAMKLGVPTYTLTQAIEWAFREGFDHFDFGRTHFDSGVFLFKRGFGGSQRRLNCMVKMYRPGRALNPSDFRYQALSKVLKVTPVPLFSALIPTLKSRME